MRIEKLVVHVDARGSVFEPLEAGDFPHQRNVHVVVTRPGEVRGNHRHRRGFEIITVTGAALVRVRVDGEIRDVDVPAGEAWRFRFSPGESHAIRNTGDSDHILVAFNTEIHDPGHPDTVRDVLIPPPGTGAA
jgi:UDP-2-acetamido-2,6-beta-L-arabino-hexul-4-ose reductase